MGGGLEHDARDARPAPATGTGSPRRCEQGSPWTTAARSLLPLPVAVALLLAPLALPGRADAWATPPAGLVGPLAFALALAALVLGVHRPALGPALRWMSAVVGAGLTGELLAAGGADLVDPAALGSPALRALSVVLAGSVLYELAPLVAASSRIMAAEWRSASLDLTAYSLLLGLAGLAAATPAPRADLGPEAGLQWVVSPAMATAALLPLAATRCGPRPSIAPARPPRVSARGPWVVALLGWTVVALVAGRLGPRLAGVLPAWWRRGLPVADGVLVALLATSLLLCLAACAARLAQAERPPRSRSDAGRAVAPGPGPFRGSAARDGPDHAGHGGRPGLPSAPGWAGAGLWLAWAALSALLLVALLVAVFDR
ncbi:MAG: hypothetical protein ACFCGT_24000 [Sandaracinaceae bacterium]